MKDYLELVRISDRLHRKRSRMTRLCIILAVALASVIFGMADMEIRSQKLQTAKSNGTWHVMLRGIGEEQAALIASRPEVEAGGWYGTKNYRLDEGYCIEGTQTCVLGMEKAALDFFPGAGIEEGGPGWEPGSAVVTKSVKERLGLGLGDTFLLSLPYGGTERFTITGIMGDFSMLTSGDAFGIYINMDDFHRITVRQRELARSQGMENEKMKLADSVFLIRFVPFCSIPKCVEGIKTDFGLEEGQTTENIQYLALLLQSGDSYILKLYLTAALLAVLVVLAGILMITGSLNGSVAWRTEFFGLLACLGASQKQIRRYVRKEALLWCRTAIPWGLGIGVAVVWLLCGILRFFSPVLFEGLPVLGISWVGLGAGTLIGLTTVLLAVQTPARRAGRVPPLTAVSGNGGSVRRVRHFARTGLFRVDTALGIHHAVGAPGGFVLLSGSFALSIVLFLAFSTLIDFGRHSLRPLKPFAPDLSLESGGGNILSRGLAEELRTYPGVKRVYGRSFAGELPVWADGQEKRIDLISYEAQQFAWAEKALLSGSVQTAAEGEGALVVYREGNALKEGSLITLDTPWGRQEVRICGVLSDSPFVQEGETELVICSEELFARLAGEAGYAVIDVQLYRGAGDEEAQAMRAMAGEGVRLSDRRLSNSETKGAYLSFMLCVYGFMAVILLISVVHIINSISMSVDSRMKQYGVMRAIGMSRAQLIKMVAAEAASYGLAGCAAGCLAGLVLHRMLFEMLVTSRWGTPWQFPGAVLGVILPLAAAAVVLAVWLPAGRLGSACGKEGASE